MKYRVTQSVSGYEIVEVKAKNKKEAIDKVWLGNYEENQLIERNLSNLEIEEVEKII